MEVELRDTYTPIDILAIEEAAGEAVELGLRTGVFGGGVGHGAWFCG